MISELCVMSRLTVGLGVWLGSGVGEGFAVGESAITSRCERRGSESVVLCLCS